MLVQCHRQTTRLHVLVEPEVDQAVCVHLFLRNIPQQRRQQFQSKIQAATPDPVVLRQLHLSVSSRQMTMSPS